MIRLSGVTSTLSRAVLAAALCLTAAKAVTAQTPATATVRGRVTDASGANVAGATLTLSNVATGVVRTAHTDAEGLYTLALVPLTGQYTLAVAKDGFAAQQKGPFPLAGSQTAILDVVLAPGAVAEEVRVTGTADAVRGDAPQLGTRFDTLKVENTPLLGRKLTSLPLLNSAVRPARGTGDLFLNETLSVIDGGGRRQTTYTVDGISGDDSWGRQTIATTLPLPAVQEVNVLTSSFSAEYGRTTGGAINLVTRAGTNQLHVDASGLYRPGGLSGDQPVTGTSGYDNLWQGSGIVSGPIVTDKAYFSAGGEYNSQNRDATITSPLDPGTFRGDFEQSLLFARVDANVTDQNHLFGKFSADQFYDTNPQDVVGGLNLPSAGREFVRKTWTYLLADSAVFSSSVFNDARGQYLDADPITKFTPIDPSTQFVRPGVSTEGESRSALLTNEQWQVADTASFSLGSHLVKFGGDYIHSKSGGNGQEFGAPFVLGQFTFKPGISPSIPTSDLTIDDVTRYTQGFGNVTYSVSENIWSLFLQDDWWVSNDLTLNLGLRYDRQDLTDAKNNFQPRFGFAWRPGHDGKTAIRGGYAMYYSEIRANIVAGWELNGPTGFFTFSAAPGQLGFPSDLQPLPEFPPGAVLPPRDITIRPGRADYYSQFFDVSKLNGYPDELVNPRTQQITIGGEREIAPTWILSADYVHARTDNIDRNLDLNAPAFFDRTQPGQTRSASAADATRPITPVPNGYKRILVTVNQGHSLYDALQLNLNHFFDGKGQVLLSYTWSHARNNFEADAPGGDPNDVNDLNAEWANSVLNQPNRLVLSGWYVLPFRIIGGGSFTYASGRPFNITTGVDNNGDGSNVDRPVVDGAVVGRNAGEGTDTVDLSLFLGYDFPIGGSARLGLRAECLNVTNHANIYGRNGTWGNDPSGVPLPSFGSALGGVANVEPARQFQFMIRLTI
jgi:outer membrane receptor protein involved in Fe transport